MIIFRASKEQKQIIDFCKKENILNDEAHFQCYVDQMFDYKLIKNGKHYNFTILAEDENFVKEQSIEWLIDLKKVYYFEFYTEDFQVVFNVNDNKLN